MTTTLTFAIGIDVGTSGARLVVIDQEGQVQAEVNRPFESKSGQASYIQPTNHHGDNRETLWHETLMLLLDAVPPKLRQQVASIAINGTSATVLLCDRAGRPVIAPKLYNEGVSEAVLDSLKAITPAHHPVLSTTSSLAKLYDWIAQVKQSDSLGVSNGPLYFLHQADWLAYLLHGRLGLSDYHNSLKLGYDVGQLAYPAWFSKLPPSPIQLPTVVAPGTPLGPVTPAIATRFGFSPTCRVQAGTTDSIAAFLASGARQPGEAVTSLGSTLVLKLLSTTRVDDARYGVYSHRLGDLWLVGGASNTGGAVLRQFFTDEELWRLSDRIPSDQPSDLSYYPLPKPGERFPINDPNLMPQLEPRPDDSVQFLHGLLDGMAHIEAQGYQLLERLGATPLRRVYTAGGGAKNQAWTCLRAQRLGCLVQISPQAAAAYGTARLALNSIQ